MSTVHDTTNIRPYTLGNLPKLDDSLLPFLSQELRQVAITNLQIITALKAIEARIVAGGL